LPMLSMFWANAIELKKSKNKNFIMLYRILTRNLKKMTKKIGECKIFKFIFFFSNFLSIIFSFL